MQRSFGVMFCYSAVCLLCAVIQVQGSKLLNSLECYNNYTWITCTWTANRPYAHLVNMTLNEGRNIICQNHTQSNLTWTCAREKYIYARLTEEYQFLPDHSLETQLNLTDKDTGLTEHPKPIMYYNENGYFLLWSEANYALENQMQEISQCESRHKKMSETWEKSSMGECINTWAVYKPEPGRFHVAQMRVKYNSGHWSNWSSEVALEPKKAVDEAKPQNLRCMQFVGQVLCVWEVRVEVADAVSFKLFYNKTESDKNEKCNHTCQTEVPNVLYISCRCSIKTDNLNPASWQISVKPEIEVKTIKACYQIRYGPPINLTIQEKEQGQLYQARWSIEAIKSGLKPFYQICYWREGQVRKNEKFPDCPYEQKNKSSNEDRVLALHLGNELEPLSKYNIKVRMRILHEGPRGNCPGGPWSEWSKTENWKTKAVPNHMLLYIMIPICTIAFIVGCIFGYKYMRRYKKKWEGMIPDPSKSNLILNFQQKKKKSQSYLYCSEYHAYEELADSCRVNNPNSIDMFLEEEHISTYCSLAEVPDEEDKYDETALTIESGYQPFEELVHESQSKDYLEEHFAPLECDDNDQQSQFVPIAFDGPYLFYP